MHIDQLITLIANSGLSAAEVVDKLEIPLETILYTEAFEPFIINNAWKFIDEQDLQEDGPPTRGTN